MIEESKRKLFVTPMFFGAILLFTCSMAVGFLGYSNSPVEKSYSLARNIKLTTTPPTEQPSASHPNPFIADVVINGGEGEGETDIVESGIAQPASFEIIFQNNFNKKAKFNYVVEIIDDKGIEIFPPEYSSVIKILKDEQLAEPLNLPEVFSDDGYFLIRVTLAATDDETTPTLFGDYMDEEYLQVEDGLIYSLGVSDWLEESDAMLETEV